MAMQYGLRRNDIIGGNQLNTSSLRKVINIQYEFYEVSSLEGEGLMKYSLCPIGKYSLCPIGKCSLRPAGNPLKGPLQPHQGWRKYSIELNATKGSKEKVSFGFQQVNEAEKPIMGILPLAYFFTQI